MSGLVERLELIAAWHLPGGRTPKQPYPDVYTTVAEAATCITSLEAQIAQLRADNAALVALIIELADDLEIEVRDRWGDDERLGHKLKRDMDVINRARALIAPHGDKTND